MLNEFIQHFLMTDESMTDELIYFLIQLVVAVIAVKIFIDKGV